MNLDWLCIGSSVLLKNSRLSSSDFRHHFKLPPCLVEYVWRRLLSQYDCEPKHLLWTFHFLKSRNPDGKGIASLLHADIRALKRQVVRTLRILIKILPEFDFSKRFNGWPHLSPSCLADSTFARIKRPYLSTWEYFCKEKKDHSLVYQVVCSLGKPFRFLSFEGPFKGSAADVSILRETIIPLLREGERVMTDKGYWQEEKCWTPPVGNVSELSDEQKAMRRKVTRIRQVNERLIGRLTFWGIFKRRWQSSWRLHKLCAHVVARLTQLEVHVYPLT